MFVKPDLSNINVRSIMNSTVAGEWRPHKKQISASFCTKGLKIPADTPTQRTEPAKVYKNNSIKGLTLEDYIRGRSSSDLVKKLEEGAERRPTDSVVQLRKEDAVMCFRRNFQIQQEDQDNYSETNKQSRRRNESRRKGRSPDLQTDICHANNYEHLKHQREHVLPEIHKNPQSQRREQLRRKINKHIKTENAQDSNSPSPDRNVRRRMMTTYDETFFPIHSLGREKMRKSFYRREDGSNDSKPNQESKNLNKILYVGKNSKDRQRRLMPQTNHPENTNNANKIYSDINIYNARDRLDHSFQKIIATSKDFFKSDQLMNPHIVMQPPSLKEAAGMFKVQKGSGGGEVGYVTKYMSKFRGNAANENRQGIRKKGNKK